MIVSWMTTNQCNLKCVHCYQDAEEATERELSTDEAKKMIDEIARAGFKIMIFSGGEPLLRPDIYELVAHAASRGLRPVFGSNGTLITDEVAAYNESLGASALPFAEGEEAPLPVAVDSCQAGEGKLWVVYRYKDSEAFRDFAREYHDKANETISFGTGTALAGQEAGWFTGGDFVKLGRGDEVTAARQKDLERLGKERGVMVEADHSIILQTEGKILYVTRNVAVLGKNTVQIPEGKHYVVFR